MLKYHKNLKELPTQQEAESKAIGSTGNYTEIEFDNMDLT